MKNILNIVALLTFCLVSSGQPIALNPENPHYFIFRGKPMVIVSSGEHYGAVINPDFNFFQYLNTLQNEGMNYTRMFAGSYFEKEGSFGIEKNTLAPAPGKALLPWARSTQPGAVCGGNKFDLDQWNNDYFIRLKEFVKEASERGIIVEVTLFSSIYGYWDIQVWNPINNINIKTNISRNAVQTLDNGPVLRYQENFVRKIVMELNQFDNVIFEIQNEPWADHPVKVSQKSEYINSQDFRDKNVEWRNNVDLADQASLEWQKKIAEIIADEEGTLRNRHLIAQNYCNFYYPVTDVDPRVSVMNFHYDYPVVVEQNYNFGRVIAFDESGFAGGEDQTYRKQAWNFMIAGGGLFNNLDYSFAVGFENGRAVNRAPGGGSTQLRKQLKILADFLNSFNFIHMKPDRDVILQAPGAFARALSDRARQYAIYVYGGGRCNLRLKLEQGTYHAEWIDTINGITLKKETLNHGGGSLAIDSPEYTEDIALKIFKD
jgi:hypothetical protein